jgi:hypothetical protein
MLGNCVLALLDVEGLLRRFLRGRKTVVTSAASRYQRYSAFPDDRETRVCELPLTDELKATMMLALTEDRCFSDDAAGIKCEAERRNDAGWV